MLKNLNAEVPYSCESGICATCVAKVTKGKAVMKACMGLEEDQIAQGWVLTCQALPVTDEVSIDF